MSRWERGGADGIAFAFQSDAGIVGIDLDRCIDPQTGALSPLAEEIRRRFDTYTECSPSGAGLHLYVGGHLPEGRVAHTPNGKIEVYPCRRFLTVTGWALPGCPLAVLDGQEALTRLIAQLSPDPPPPLPAGGPAQRGLPVGALSDMEILERVVKCPKGTALLVGDTSIYGGDHSSADFAFCLLLSIFTDDPVQLDRIFRGSGLMRPKWDRPLLSGTYGSRTLHRAMQAHRCNAPCPRR